MSFSKRKSILAKLWFAGLAVGLSAPLVLGHRDARAAWPPASNADLTNPQNWPNDPLYKDTSPFFSWLPKQERGTEPYLDADLAIGAAGMSVDRAWTKSIGRSDVRIAVTDSGILWDWADLVNQTYINAGELLGAKKPRKANGDACGGSGSLAGYDCNGDGVFSVGDYRDDVRFSTPVPGEPCNPGGDRNAKGPDRISGDLNRNCLLDAGDLIEFFSDGTDDDGNGYIDDICGWDFFKNDNNPFDDTRYEHGSIESRDALAEGNNGVDGLGMCPKCRLVPLRVSDSFVADANDFGKAVLYATDNGAKVLLEALGTLDQTPLARGAIDYAYAHGTTVIASMADENSRHHMMPALANHTLPVHAIQYDGASATSSRSFLAFNKCSNYGGQNMLSVSTNPTGCSSEAVARAAGAAGLIYSYALDKGTTLAPEELMQLLKMTADDIDVAESRTIEKDSRARYYYSQAGFDQRFGYGRLNVSRVFDAIESGAIPPEVDLTSPAWFDVLYEDRTPVPVAVSGSVSAKRAASYDYTVEWAPGVQPLDDQFKALIADVVNVPGQTISGAKTAPLAYLDPRLIDTTHIPDSDSKYGENARSITLRVRATAHYAGGADVRGEARRTLAIVNKRNGGDQELLKGFPFALGGSMEASPKVADLDGDRIRDIVVASGDGSLHVLSMKTGVPTELPGFPYRTRLIDGVASPALEQGVPDYTKAPAYNTQIPGHIDTAIAREAILSAPAVGDIDGDGRSEIVFTTFAGTMYVVTSRGENLTGWPKRLPLVPSCPLDPSKTKPAVCMDVKSALVRGAWGSPALVDLDRDGKLDILQPAFDGNLYAFKANGAAVDGYPVQVTSGKQSRLSRIFTSPTLADFNGDGIIDIATGSSEEIGGGGNAGPVFIIDGRGNKAPGGPFLRGWPITMSSIHLFPLVAEGIVASQATADFDRDGKPDLLIQGNGAPGLILPSVPGDQPLFGEPANKLPISTDEDGKTRRGLEAASVFGKLSKAFKPDTMFPLLSQPSIGDLDMDGTPDIIMSGGSLSLAANLSGGSVVQPFQHLLGLWSGKTGSMFPGSPVILEDYTFLTGQSVADVSGDGYPEVLLGTGVYFVRAVDACGREAPGFPKFTNGWIAAAPAVADLDGDHSLELVTGTREGYLFAWHTRGRDDGVIQWESFRHDNRNTGNFAEKLDQGVASKPLAPLSCDDPEAAKPVDRYLAGGGCSTSPLSGSRSGFLLAMVGSIVAYARRRRLTRGDRRLGQTTPN